MTSNSDVTLSASLLVGSEAVRARVASEIQSTLNFASRDDREKMALICRFLADQGHTMSLLGQITVRNDDGTYFTNNLMTGFAEVQRSNVLRVDDSLNVIEGDGMANPATRFHMWIYARRPEIRCIIHTHAPHASALAMTATPLQVAHMDMMMFYDDCALLPQWPGVPVANEEGRIISEALQDKHSILLANHGLLTVGENLDHAAYLAANLEYAARLQLLTGLTGRPIQPVAPELAREARRMATLPRIMTANVEHWLRLTERRYPEALQ